MEKTYEVDLDEASEEEMPDGYKPPPQCRVGRSLNHVFHGSALVISLGFSAAPAEPAHQNQ